MRTHPTTMDEARAQRRSAGFSLIELLVVIAVIIALAGLTFPVVNAVKVAQAKARARAELGQIQLAIDAYKEKLGFYPPDNTADWFEPPLYYELMGVTVTTGAGNQTNQTLDGSAMLRASEIGNAFPGGKVTGFLNRSKVGAGEEVAGAVQFLKNLKPAQFMAQIRGSATVYWLGVSMSGSPVVQGLTGEIIPYGYCSTSPRYNTKTYDLWVDIVAGGKTNRICNWSERPIIVNYGSRSSAYP